jgi:hypothetical protein
MEAPARVSIALVGQRIFSVSTLIMDGARSKSYESLWVLMMSGHVPGLPRIRLPVGLRMQLERRFRSGHRYAGPIGRDKELGALLSIKS